MSAEVLRYSAFTHEGQGGNPAGVVLDARNLTEAQMLAIAHEVGYSETAFLSPSAETDNPEQHPMAVASGSASATYVADIRFFSPLAEVVFCGHATVACAAALARKNGPGHLLLHTAAGPLMVDTWTSGEAAGATLTSPPATSQPAAAEDLAAALGAFGWNDADLDPRFQPHIANAGNNHLMLPVRSRETLAAMDYDFAQLGDLMAEKSWTTVNVFWAESAGVFHARNPFPPGGVVEDPATGAAAAAFGGYLREIGHATGQARVTIHQGHDMGMPSELTVELVPGQPGIRVSGQATPLPSTPPPV